MRKWKSRWLSAPAAGIMCRHYAIANPSLAHVGCIEIAIFFTWIYQRGPRCCEVKVGKGGRNFLPFLITQRTCRSATCQRWPHIHPVWPLVCGRRSPLSLPVRRRAMSPTLMVVGSECLWGPVNNPHHLSYRQVTPQLSFFHLKVLLGAFQSENGVRILHTDAAVYVFLSWAGTLNLRFLENYLFFQAKEGSLWLLVLQFWARSRPCLCNVSHICSPISTKPMYQP